MDDESWIPIPCSSDFQLHNLPVGIFKAHDRDARIGVAIGDYVLDMKILAEENVFASLSFDHDTLKTAKLNRYASLGRAVHRRVRGFLVELLAKDTKYGHLLRDDADRPTRTLLLMETAQMLLPLDVPNYTDFFVGVHHAQYCVDIVRPGTGLNKNYFHLPVAYHGRASSVVVSDTPVRRPKGQYATEDGLVFGPTRQMDFEVEFAAFIGTETQLGDSVDVNRAEEHIFGVVLMNDWSARDIQRWESPSLGPFNGKNFCTTVSPWVVSLDALADYRVNTVKTETQPLSYLTEAMARTAFDIPLQASITSADGRKYTLCTTNTRHVIFSFAQMIAHHTAGGCPLRTGDLIATGTVSGPKPEEAASLLELSKGGHAPVKLQSTGSNQTSHISRNFLEDGDEVEIRAALREEGSTVGFGVCRGRIMAAR